MLTRGIFFSFYFWVDWLGCCPLEGEHVGKTAHFCLLLGNHLVVLVNDGDGQQNASAGANRAHEIGHDGEGTDAHATKSRLPKKKKIKKKNYETQFHDFNTCVL